MIDGSHIRETLRSAQEILRRADATLARARGGAAPAAFDDLLAGAQAEPRTGPAAERTGR